MIKQETKLLWHDWIKVTRDRCHLHFELEKNDLELHIETCLKVSERTAQRISEDIKKKPKLNLSDGMHPNGQGTIIISNTLKKVILENL